MIRKLIWGMIKSALSPLFIALAVLRKTKNAILKIFGVSRKAATTAADATATAKDAAETAAEKRDTESTDERQRSVESQPTDPTETSGQPADFESQYQRFQTLLVGLVLYMAVLPIALGVASGSLQFISTGELLRASVFAAALPAVLAGLARVRSKYAWGITLGLTALLALSSVLQAVGFAYIFSSNTLTPTTGRIAANQPLIYIVTLGQIALLGAILRTGWKGRPAVYGEPSAPSQPTANSNEGTKTPDPKSSAIDQQTTTDTTSAETNQQKPATGGASSTAANDASRAQSSTDATPQAASDTAVAEPDQNIETTQEPGDTEEDATANESNSTDGSDNTPTEIHSAIEELDTGPVTPDKIRALGDKLPRKDVPEEAITAIQQYEAADDPDVRFAVCELCSSIEDEWADDILKNRRIDTNDQVATTAIDALR